MNIGEVFYRENQIDSAWVYLSRAFNESPSINSKKQAAEWLVKICKAQGKDCEAHEFAEFLVPFANWEENQGFVKSQLTEQYKNYVQRRQEHVHKQERKKNIMWTLTIIGCLLVLLSSIAILYFKNRKKKQHLEMQIETERQAHKIQQEALSGKLKKNNEVLRLRKEETENLRRELKMQQKQKDWGGMDEFLNEDICRTIMVLFQGKEIKREAKRDDYPELHLSISQLSQLNIAVEKHFSGFGMMLTDLFPKISHDEMNQCQLCLLNLEDVQIASLLNCDYSTIKKRSGKLRKVFGTEKELQFFIRGFVL